MRKEDKTPDLKQKKPLPLMIIVWLVTVRATFHQSWDFQNSTYGKTSGH